MKKKKLTLKTVAAINELKEAGITLEAHCYGCWQVRVDGVPETYVYMLSNGEAGFEIP